MLRQRPQFKGEKGVGKTGSGVGRGGDGAVLVLNAYEMAIYPYNSPRIGLNL